MQSLGLLINLVEHCDVNRRKVIDAKTHRSFEFDCLGNKGTVPAAKALVQVNWLKKMLIIVVMLKMTLIKCVTPQLQAFHCHSNIFELSCIFLC